MDRVGAVLVDTYRIDRLIAEGGMGAVYEASHVRIPKKFAVKFLKLSLLDNSVALLRFRREAEVIATLDHPAIVSLIDYNITDDGVPYTILEYLEGEHLGDRVSRGSLSLTDTLKITDAVTGALHSAHARGVIHRDLKPENVILCAQGSIKVVDFGIAKLRGAEQLTAFNSILGTITYMAPEQLTASEIDARADQFALAAMVYEMLSGDMPFGSDGTIPEIADRVLRKQPPQLQGYPQDVFDVLLRALSKKPTDRYDNVRDFCDALVEVTRPLLPNKLDTPVEPNKALVEGSTEPDTADEGLPELPGERTSISSSPTTVVAPSGMHQTLPATSTTDQPVEPTRITQAPLLAPISMAVQKKSSELVTGRTDAVEQGPLKLLGRRGGLIVGIALGFMLALFVRLFVH